MLVRFDTGNGKHPGTDALLVSRNNSYFLLHDSGGGEVRRILDEGGEKSWSGRAPSNEHEAIAAGAVVAAMDDVLERRRAPRRGLALLLRMLADERSGVRWDAIVHLGKLGARAAPAVPLLCEVLRAEPGTPEGKQASWAARTLGQIGPAARAALPHLSETAATGDPALAQASARALGRIDPQGRVSLPILIAVLERGEIEGIGASLAISDLGARGAPAVPALMATVRRSENPAARLHAVRALGAVGPGAFRAIALLEAIGEPPELSKAARAALARIRR